MFHSFINYLKKQNTFPPNILPISNLVLTCCNTSLPALLKFNNLLIRPPKIPPILVSFIVPTPSMSPNSCPAS